MHRLVGRALLIIGSLVSLTSLVGCNESSGANGKANSLTLLNVSYDPTREFYQELNASFAENWQKEHGQHVSIEQSHGGSGKQARAVIDGLEADVVTLALGNDLDAIASKSGLIETNWKEKFPHNSAPYTSTIVFLVRKGNPKGIRDWGDLIKDDVSVITANPKTGGGARWNYLAAWGYAMKQHLGSWDKLKDPASKQAANKAAREFVTQLYKRVPVLDPAARGSTNTFVQRELGDVLLSWENEAFLAVKELGADKVEIVVPSISILAEPPVAVVTKVAARRGTSEVAQAYLQHLYSPEGQRLAAKHFFRPIDETVLGEAAGQKFAHLELFTIDDVFGGWNVVQPEHFDDGGVFDQIYQPGK